MIYILHTRTRAQTHTHARARAHTHTGDITGHQHWAKALVKSVTAAFMKIYKVM